VQGISVCIGYVPPWPGVRARGYIPKIYPKYTWNSVVANSLFRNTAVCTTNIIPQIYCFQKHIYCFHTACFTTQYTVSFNNAHYHTIFILYATSPHTLFNTTPPTTTCTTLILHSASALLAVQHASCSQPLAVTIFISN
jgi:hypothetical protein